MVALLLTLYLTAGSGAGVSGGALLTDEASGVAIWHKESGPKTGPVVVFIHGGPGANSYEFEKAVGRKLERRLRMVYLDQRGSGRSPLLDDPARFGMDALVDDIERLRLELGVNRIGIIAHAFGGVIALEYFKKYSDRVSGMVLVESTADLPRAFQSQLSYLAKISHASFKGAAAQLEKLASSEGEAPSSRLMRAYQLVGPDVAQRQLEGSSLESQETVENWQQANGLPARPARGFIERMRADGYLDTRRADLMVPLRIQGVLFVGRRSHALGAEVVRETSNAWHIPALWFEHSGHLPFVDEPDLFASRAIAILAQ